MCSFAENSRFVNGEPRKKHFNMQMRNGIALGEEIQDALQTFDDLIGDGQAAQGGFGLQRQSFR